jgi:pimeloyl-ACP methyl ester carboxylesterase
MKHFLLILLSLLTFLSDAQSKIQYGNNKAAGKYYQINDIKMYLETYGQGKPLLLIHGNGGSIEHLKNQIAYFKKTRKVYVADSRGHGKSSFIEGQVYNYDLLTKDWAVLLDSLKISNLDVFGWSDGGIIGLLLARDYPQRIAKVYSYGANMSPGEDAIEGRVVRGLRKLIASESPKTPSEKNAFAITKMMMDYPKEDLSTFKKVKIPVMIATADHDLILLEHSLQIYRNLGNAAFQSFGMANHFISWEEPNRLNKEIEMFFNKPFKQANLVPKEYEFLLDK